MQENKVKGESQDLRSLRARREVHVDFHDWGIKATTTVWLVYVVCFLQLCVKQRRYNSNINNIK
jgi:hypothetical protein